MGWILETDATLEGEPKKDSRHKIDDQLKVAKQAAKQLLREIDGPARVYLRGFRSPELGDTVSVTVSQKIDPPPGFVG